MNVAYSEFWEQHHLIEVGCDSCGSAMAFRVAVRSDGLSVVECPRCGLAYINPRPRDEIVARLYDGREYFQKHGTHQNLCLGYDDYDALAASYWGRNQVPELDMIEQVRPLAGCRLLEVGCATGELLALARNRGARPLGVEISPYAAQRARERHNLEVRAGPLENLELPAQSFDVALALEVIEHVTSPRRFLAAVTRLLEPGGILALSTPNYRCSLPLGDRWLGFQSCFEHLYFFSPLSLMRLASDYRLDLVFWATRGDGVVNCRGKLSTGLREVIKKIPGAKRLYRALKAPHAFEPWEYFGQGHYLFALFKLNGHA
jgi:2-polyprenyl-3-methyl-5-hydroxy-6-metoxy-1,4-benzoquinol methylase